MRVSRRHWMAAATAGALSLSCAAGASEAGSGFFQIRRFGKRWLLATPEGEPFFSMGLNHLDPVSALAHRLPPTQGEDALLRAHRARKQRSQNGDSHGVVSPRT